MWQEAPIYDQLVTELGGIPSQVRSEAERSVRHLEQVIRPGTPWTGGLPQPAGPFTSGHR
ncbi:hypothetical protein SLUN_01445 [Streptomyces lunaelactis]|uniref:Uncharacterized protein n=1 Tax=Streptomyces lunaelactis TaxID=1535768 RepID=A0A2R4SW66_9ACTN|nr:hypothetical protein SLUN_01445 [Streptomyces lunaelactis]